MVFVKGRNRIILSCFRSILERDHPLSCALQCYPLAEGTPLSCSRKSKGSFFWDYSGKRILGIDGICVLLGAIPFSE